LIKVSYHNHTSFSDGKNTPAQMLETAIQEQFTHFAFTDHIHVKEGVDWTMDTSDYEAYIAQINSLKSMAPSLKVFAGIEVDWYLGRQTGSWSKYESLQPHLDFVVGSVHAIEENGMLFFVDGSYEELLEGLEKAFNGDVKKMATRYFETYNEMLEGLSPNLAAHPDLLRLYTQGKLITTGEDWYMDLLLETARLMGKLGITTEVNMGGDYRKKNGIVYPQDQFLAILKENNVKVTVGLDSHSAEMVGAYYDDSLAVLSRAGFGELAYFEDSQWKKSPINIPK